MNHKLLKFSFLLMVLILFLLSGTFGEEKRKQKSPNIVIIVADDATYNDLPLYGGTNVQTPNIDRLAEEGMTFNQAYLSMSMSAPSRAELYTGMYPVRNGVCWNNAPARTDTRSIVHYLGNLGYRVGIAGKIHASPRSTFCFDWIDGLERDCVSDSAEFDDAGMRCFIEHDKNQPFCMVAALVVPHLPWTVGDPSHFTPAKLKLPHNLADTKETREHFARYLAEIEVLDQQVGRIMKMLEETGKAENTIVVFTTEQGSAFPGCKWTNWDTGVHTGFVVRWPGKVSAGERTNALIQYADVLPTLLEAVGGDPLGKTFSGTSFLPVLLGKENKHREYAYFMHNNVPEGPPYPIRSVTDGRYHYIRNLLPDRLYMEKQLMGRMPQNTYWPSWQFHAARDRYTYRLVKRYMHRPEEELYLLESDPYEFKNLAEVSSHQEAKKRLSNELNRWMDQQGDPGADIDTWEAYNAARKGKHFGH